MQCWQLHPQVLFFFGSLSCKLIIQLKISDRIFFEDSGARPQMPRFGTCRVHPKQPATLCYAMPLYARYLLVKDRYHARARSPCVPKGKILLAVITKRMLFPSSLRRPSLAMYFAISWDDPNPLSSASTHLC